MCAARSDALPILNARMTLKRHVRTKARAKRRLKAMAWRLGITPELLRAVLRRRKNRRA